MYKRYNMIDTSVRIVAAGVTEILSALFLANRKDLV